MSNITAVIILASDKETLKKSLIHVDQFLKQVGQKIDTERDFLQSVGRRNAPARSAPTTDQTTTSDGVSNEDYANLWFGANKFDFNPKPLNSRKKHSDVHVPKKQKGFSNFNKAVATLDEGELKKETTIKLKNAVQDLRGLLESGVDVKYRKHSTKLDTLRKMQEALKKRSKKNYAGNTKKSKRDNDENSDQFDVFGGMDFPQDSYLPSGISTHAVPVTGGGPTPDILNNQFIEEDEEAPGPGPEVMATPSTTTVDKGPVLDPNQFGQDTTMTTLPTFGDIKIIPEVQQYLTTYVPNDFVASLKADMEKFHFGVFSIAMLKILHIIIWKDEEVAKKIARGLAKVITKYEFKGYLEDFGQPTKDSLVNTAHAVEAMPHDEMRSQVILLHNGFLHRREMFSGDVNSLMDHVDELYSRAEAKALLQSLEPLEQYMDPNKPTDTMLELVVDNVLSPWRRLKNSPRGHILKTALNRALKNHFYPGDYSYNRRAITINIPVEYMTTASPPSASPPSASPPSASPPRASPPSTPPPNFRSANIKVYRIGTRKDNLNENIYNTDLQTLYNNFMRTKNEQARTSRGNINDKPLFNKQLKNNLNIVNDKRVNNLFGRLNDKPAPLRINFNAKVTGKPNGNRIMIITNDNQAKSNIIRSGPVFRSSDSYVDFNVVNMTDTLVRDGDQLELDLYPDMPVMASDAPLTPPPRELNFQIEGDNLNLQVDGNEKLIVIKEEHDAPAGTLREDIDLKMSSSSSARKRKHHKRHHKKHKRTHGHNNLKEKLARIKKIVKKYRLGHRKSKHKRHHKRGKHKKTSGSLSIKETAPFSSPVMRNSFNATKSKQISDRRFQVKDSLSSTRATVDLSEFTTQVYAVRNNFIKNLRRKMMNGDVRANWAKRASVQSDDEIALRRNLYKAMTVGRRGLPRRRNERARRPNKRSFLRDSTATDEEAQLKNNIYNYFNNIQPE